MTLLLNDKLNDEQKKVILNDNSILLVACPGSGKTRTLTYKIAYEINNLNSSREYIIAITYTNRAAEEIKDRLDKIGIDTKQLWIGTIHSFSLEWIVRPYHHCIDELKFGFSILNSYESELLITQLCKENYGKSVSYYDCGYFVTPRGYRLGCLEDDKHPMIKDILRKYFDILKDSRQVDFEQILYYAYQILNRNPIIANTLKDIIKFILIDEYQDTKEIQYHIIAKILNAGGGLSRVFIVGDPNQSIYSTLGGFPMEKEELEKIFGFNLCEYSLENNYRSSQKIIGYFENFKVYESTIRAEGDLKLYPSKITYNLFLSKEEVVDEIVRLIKFNLDNECILPNEICVVAPQWIHLGSITRQLTSRLPDYSFDGPGLVPFSRDIDNFWYKVAKLSLSEPSPSFYIRRLRWANDIIKELEAVGYALDGLTNKKLLKVINSIVLEEKDGLKYLELFFLELCRILKLSIESYPSIKNHYSSFFESSKARIERLRKDGADFINDISSFRKAFKPREGITISTIHGTKGEEYDTVIGFALLNDYLPHFKDKDGDENSNKLLYVMSSRARKNLHFISERGRGVNYYNPSGKSPTPNLVGYDFEYDVID